MKNIVTLVGFVGNTPEVRETSGSATITSLSLATTRSFKDGEGHRHRRPNGTASPVSTASVNALPSMSRKVR